MKLLITLLTCFCFSPLLALSKDKLLAKCKTFNSIARSHKDQIAPFIDAGMNERRAIHAVKSQLHNYFVPYPQKLQKELNKLAAQGKVIKKMLTWRQKVPGITIKGTIITQNTIAQRTTVGIFFT